MSIEYQNYAMLLAFTTLAVLTGRVYCNNLPVLDGELHSRYGEFFEKIGRAIRNKMVKNMHG